MTTIKIMQPWSTEESLRRMVAAYLRVPESAVTRAVPGLPCHATVDLRTFEGDFDDANLDFLPSIVNVDVIPRGYVETVTTKVTVTR